MKVRRKRSLTLTAILTMFAALFATVPVHAMHIMEGFLPVKWAIIWAVLALPVVIYGIKKINENAKNSKLMMLMVLTGAYIFVLSALKIPSVTGSCSHPTGSGLAAILFGPAISSVLATIVLIFQSVLIAHGGITTLGANVFSMGIVGPVVAYFVYRLVKGDGKYNSDKNRIFFAVFLASALGDLMTYVVTALQLAIAHPGESMMASFTKFASVFAVTQVPLALIEGILTAIVFSFIVQRNKEELDLLQVTA